MATRIAYQLYSGFWSVDRRTCFFDKAEALRFATQIKSFNVAYHYFDEVYHTIDWKKEPTQSLSELYRERAQQIRDEYEYVALSFSGGADSTNVLKSFINNNIRLDEVVVWYPIKATEKFAGRFNPSDRSAGNIIHEYHHAALPMLRWLAAHHPEIKITTLDYTDTAFDIIGSGMMHKSTIGGCVSHAMTTGQYMMTEHLRKVNKRCCQLLAVDKPRIKYNKVARMYEAYFLDFNSLLGHWPADTFNRNEPKTEYFYYAYQLPQLLVKQCYEIKKAVQRIERKADFIEDYKFNRNIELINPHNDFVKKVIYGDNWDTSTFQAGKAVKYFYHEHTTWFFDLTKNDKRTTDFYNGQIEDMVDAIHPSFIDYENGKPIRFKNIITRPIAF